jgi:sugar-specific transcriptional regulator TrmB
MESSIHDALRTFGLSDNQVRTYLALLELGEASVSAIAEKAGTYRTLAYELLDALQRQGLVSSVKKERKRIYVASPPKQLLSLLGEKERALKEVLPILGQLHSSHLSKPEITFFLGGQGYKTLLEDILNEGKPLSYYGSKIDINKEIKYYMPYFIRERVKRKLKARLILDAKPVARDRTEYRLVKKRFKVGTWIYGDRVAIIILKKSEPVCIQIKNKEYADHQRAIFELLWENLPKP